MKKSLAENVSPNGTLRDANPNWAPMRVPDIEWKTQKKIKNEVFGLKHVNIHGPLKLSSNIPLPPSNI